MTKITNIIVLCLILAMTLIPSAMAGDGENGVKLVPADGSSSVDKNGIQKVDDTKETKVADDDVWGLEKGNTKSYDYVNVDSMMGIFSGITPVSNVSKIGVSLSFGLSLVSTVIVGFILVMKGGYGAVHPNDTKGGKLLSSATSKLVLVFGLFFLMLFMIICMFFFLYIFSKIGLYLV